MYRIFRHFLFVLDPEKAHRLTFTVIKILDKCLFLRRIIRFNYLVKDEKLERQVFGINFKNPVGLAAGLDKDASNIEELSNFGFGFIEIGTITPRAQKGNDRPRVFRLKRDNALINRMGFNNLGVHDAVRKLKKIKKDRDVIIGGNIGKNKDTPNEKALQDYEICFDELHDYVDYFVINVSSPNTPNLRELQEKEPLKKILETLQNKNNLKEKRKPILLKIAPDLNNGQLDDIIEVVLETKIDGVVATNTTLSRDNLKTDKRKIEQIGIGGLSGEPLKNRATEIIRYISKKSKKMFGIIGVGGIMNPEDAIEKLNAGASLVQIYTGFIYNGPALVKQINKEIIK